MITKNRTSMTFKGFCSLTWSKNFEKYFPSGFLIILNYNIAQLPWKSGTLKNCERFILGNNRRIVGCRTIIEKTNPTFSWLYGFEALQSIFTLATSLFYFTITLIAFFYYRMFYGILSPSSFLWSACTDTRGSIKHINQFILNSQTMKRNCYPDFYLRPFGHRILQFLFHHMFWKYLQSIIG